MADTVHPPAWIAEDVLEKAGEYISASFDDEDDGEGPSFNIELDALGFVITVHTESISITDTLGGYWVVWKPSDASEATKRSIERQQLKREPISRSARDFVQTLLADPEARKQQVQDKLVIPIASVVFYANDFEKRKKPGAGVLRVPSADLGALANMMALPESAQQQMLQILQQSGWNESSKDVLSQLVQRSVRESDLDRSRPLYQCLVRFPEIYIRRESIACKLLALPSQQSESIISELTSKSTSVELLLAFLHRDLKSPVVYGAANSATHTELKATVMHPLPAFEAPFSITIFEQDRTHEGVANRFAKNVYAWLDILQREVWQREDRLLFLDGRKNHGIDIAGLFNNKGSPDREDTPEWVDAVRHSLCASIDPRYKITSSAIVVPQDKTAWFLVSWNPNPNAVDDAQRAVESCCRRCEFDSSARRSNDLVDVI